MKMISNIPHKFVYFVSCASSLAAASMLYINRNFYTTTPFYGLAGFLLCTTVWAWCNNFEEDFSLALLCFSAYSIISYFAVFALASSPMLQPFLFFSSTITTEAFALFASYAAPVLSYFTLNLCTDLLEQAYCEDARNNTSINYTERFALFTFCFGLGALGFIFHFAALNIISYVAAPLLNIAAEALLAKETVSFLAATCLEHGVNHFATTAIAYLGMLFAWHHLSDFSSIRMENFLGQNNSSSAEAAIPPANPKTM